jgi:hypothetical protein
MAPPLGDGFELEPQSQAGVVPQSVPGVSQDKTFDEDSSKAFDKAFHVAFNSVSPRPGGSPAPTTGSTS